jgi:NAD+ synthase
MTLHPWLRFDPAHEVQSISANMKKAVLSTLMRKGAVVAVSGGIDSSVCAALAAESLGNDKVFALLLPEIDSSISSRILGENLCNHLGISFEVKDIASTLEAIGCYKWRDDAIRSVFPEYSEGWKNKIAISQNLFESERLNFFKLIVESPDGQRMVKRLPLNPYLQIVAATNFKQRIRKTLEYFHADRLNYAVIGTPNRLEYDQGFFVKNGDGSADLKPIAHLYKSQVYELGRYLRLPEAICNAQPTTDTYSLEQGQDEFYFVLPFDKMDIILFGMNHGKNPEEVAIETGLTPEQILRIYGDIKRKRSTTKPLHMKPVLMEPVPEIGL